MWEKRCRCLFSLSLEVLFGGFFVSVDRFQRRWEEERNIVVVTSRKNRSLGKKASVVVHVVVVVAKTLLNYEFAFAAFSASSEVKQSGRFISKAVTHG